MSGASCDVTTVRITSATVGAADWWQQIRVFYDVSGATVEVLAIVAKSEAESWLVQFGNPE
jgi:hypothetical protein